MDLRQQVQSPPRAVPALRVPASNRPTAQQEVQRRMRTWLRAVAKNASWSMAPLTAVCRTWQARIFLSSVVRRQHPFQVLLRRIRFGLRQPEHRLLAQLARERAILCGCDQSPCRALVRQLVECENSALADFSVLVGVEESGQIRFDA